MSGFDGAKCDRVISYHILTYHSLQIHFWSIYHEYRCTPGLFGLQKLVSGVTFHKILHHIYHHQYLFIPLIDRIMTEDPLWDLNKLNGTPQWRVNNELLLLRVEIYVSKFQNFNHWKDVINSILVKLYRIQIVLKVTEQISVQITAITVICDWMIRLTDVCKQVIVLVEVTGVNFTKQQPVPVDPIITFIMEEHELTPIL